MPLYLITKPMTAYLQVNCKNEEEARAWSTRIVAGLEDENGKPIPPDAVYDFEADCYPEKMEIELLEDDLADQAAQTNCTENSRKRRKIINAKQGGLSNAKQ